MAPMSSRTTRSILSSLNEHRHRETEAEQILRLKQRMLDQFRKPTITNLSQVVLADRFTGVYVAAPMELRRANQARVAGYVGFEDSDQLWSFYEREDVQILCKDFNQAVLHQFGIVRLDENGDAVTTYWNPTKGLAKRLWSDVVSKLHLDLSWTYAMQAVHRNRLPLQGNQCPSWFRYQGESKDLDLYLLNIVAYTLKMMGITNHRFNGWYQPVSFKHDPDIPFTNEDFFRNYVVLKSYSARLPADSTPKPWKSSTIPQWNAPKLQGTGMMDLDVRAVNEREYVKRPGKVIIRDEETGKAYVLSRANAVVARALLEEMTKVQMNLQGGH